MIGPLTADVIGIAGSIIFLSAFAYANASPAIDKIVFNALNLIGAILLLISLSVHFNLPATLLEGCWGLIALLGLVNAIRKRRA